MKLAGRIALVTGGGSGIGEAISQAFAAEGAKVAVLDISADAAKYTAATLGEGHYSVAADVADSAAVDAAVREVENVLGPIDILVNNAGIAPPPHEFDRLMPLMEAQVAETAAGEVTTALEVVVNLSDEDWRRMLAVHLDGTFYCTRAVLRSMAGRRTGAIVNIASICGLEGCTASPSYSAAKAGILGFTRAVAKEVIVQGVRVNAIAPGYIKTPMTDQFSEMLRGMIAMSTPTGSMGRPTDIAATAVFLASDDARFYVGATLSPNGGYVTAV
jgi:3-oxoacyl-[acyl-carrier protein] reductase